MWKGHDIGAIVKQLTGGHVSSDDGAHLDPDLVMESLSRSPGWRPLFGQAKSAQGHLRNRSVGKGDLFLFFGLFQRVIENSGTLTWDSASRPFHSLWGWMQVDEVLPVENVNFSELGWAQYHPHLNCPPLPNNVIYIATESLVVGGAADGEPGAGVFSQFRDDLRLTAPGETASHWELPGWIFPSRGKMPLSFHPKIDKWKMVSSKTRLRVVSRGQEFVLDCEEYPEAVEWFSEILN